MLRLALTTAWFCLIVASTGRDASADVSYDFVFRTTDVHGQPIPGATATGRSFQFDGVPEAQACVPSTGTACPVIDILLITTVPLSATSTSVDYDAASGLAVQSTVEWKGVATAFSMGNPIRFFEPVSPGTGQSAGSRISSFDAAANLANPEDSIPAGTYKVGTVVWDTSGIQLGKHSISTVHKAGFDATAENVANTSTDITGSESFFSGAIRVGTFPNVPALSPIGLGLLAAAFVLTAVRRRSKGR